MQSHSYLSAIVLLFLGGCFSEPEYSNVPEIGFQSIEQYIILDAFDNEQGAVEITITFQDGNGDLGLEKNEGEADYGNLDFANEVYDENGELVYDEDGNTIVNKFKDNYFIEVYREEEGVFKLVEYPDGQGLSGTFPRLSDSEKEKPIEGELEYSFILLPSSGSPLNVGDVIRFEIQIADREKNVSNVIETETINIGGL